MIPTRYVLLTGRSVFEATQFDAASQASTRLHLVSSRERVGNEAIGIRREYDPTGAQAPGNELRMVSDRGQAGNEAIDLTREALEPFHPITQPIQDRRRIAGSTSINLPAISRSHGSRFSVSANEEDEQAGGCDGEKPRS